MLKEDEAEIVKTMKVSTYSNLAAAYLLLGNPQKALNACEKGQVLIVSLLSDLVCVYIYACFRICVKYMGLSAPLTCD